MKKETIDIIDIFDFWKKFDFHYLHPETLNEKEAEFIELKNHAWERDWSLPKKVEGWIFVEGWFSNMIEGQRGRYGATRLQYRPDMGKPIFLSGYDNSNNGASMWFIPQVSIGGDYSWQIRAEIQYTKRGLPEFARLYAE